MKYLADFFQRKVAVLNTRKEHLGQTKNEMPAVGSLPATSHLLLFGLCFKMTNY